mgnify:CR=1 FL=1
MLNFNLTGRLAADPEMSAYGGDDKPMAKLRVASNQPGVEDADFFDVAVFGDVAVRIIAEGHKGDKVELRGNGRQRTWTTDDGQRRERIGLAARWVKLTPHNPPSNVPNTAEQAAHASAAR